jgi:hypothetical protein
VLSSCFVVVEKERRVNSALPTAQLVLVQFPSMRA